MALIWNFNYCFIGFQYEPQLPTPFHIWKWENKFFIRLNFISIHFRGSCRSYSHNAHTPTWFVLSRFLSSNINFMTFISFSSSSPCCNISLRLSSDLWKHVDVRGSSKHIKSPFSSLCCLFCNNFTHINGDIKTFIIRTWRGNLSKQA